MSEQKKKFDAKYWLQKAKEEQASAGKTEHPDPSIPGNDVEAVIQRIQESRTDITANYADWVNIGFALSDEFGMAGRDYFHRVSRYYPGYSQKECDKQFDACLKSNGQGVKIATFFHLAQKAGIPIAVTTHNRLNEAMAACRPTKDSRGEDKKPEPEAVGTPGVDNEDEDERMYKTPCIPDDVYAGLPEFLKECTSLFPDPIERDLVLLGSLGVLSACLPKIEGVYFDESYSAHLYIFVTAPAGSGKGKLNWPRRLGNEIHDRMIAQSDRAKMEYDRELEDYNNLSRGQRASTPKPQPPKRQMFFIPANSSASAFIKVLTDNNFRGLIYETEADTMSGALKQEWGNYCDVLRKAFHHESTNMVRRKDMEHLEVKKPHLAIVMAGTPRQVHNIMPDVENGLFSRFLYYAFEDLSGFKNPFTYGNGVDFEAFFARQSKRVYDLYEILKNQAKNIRFTFSPEQEVQFTEQFNQHYSQNKLLLGIDFNANSRRLGLITFRLAMVLRSLRIMEDGDLTSPMVCTDTDFRVATRIAFTLEEHAIAVYQNLPDMKAKSIRHRFYVALPVAFTRQEYQEIARGFDIKAKTADKYIVRMKEVGLLTHEYNFYRKVNGDIGPK